MIILDNLHKRYGPKVLLNGVQFHLRPGDRVGLVGENGMGKTTLLRIICGTESVDEGNVTIRKGARVGMLEQELDAGEETVLERVVLGDAYFRSVSEQMQVLENDQEAHDRDPEQWSKRYGHLQHEFERLGGYHRDSTAKTLLAGLGFRTEQMERPLAEYSGGWRMRAELARLLLQAPDVLLLDEPTNHLDLVSVVWLESFLRNYEGSLLLISHDRRFLNNLVSRVAELDRGRLTVYAGNYDDFERLKAEREAQLESQAANQQKRIAELERFIERFRAKNTKATQAKSKQKILDKMERVETMTRTKTVDFRFPQPPRVGRIALDVKNVSKSYGDLTVYRDFSIQLERGFKIALVGINGAGKSTLLKLMAGALQPDSGEVIPGHNVTRAYFAQHNLEILDPKHTVLESLDKVADNMLLTKKRNVLGAFLFSGDDVNKKVGVLSGGEKARLALARLLAKPAPLLFLDEPTNHLDLRSCEVLAAALSDFDGTLVTISHDRFFLDGIINRVWEVDEGKVTEYLGTYSEYVAAREKAAEEALAQGTAMQEKSAGGKKGRDRKRQEAEERNQRYRKLKPLKDKLHKVESRLESVLADKSEVESALADAGLYEEDRKHELMEMLDRQKDLNGKEQDLMTEWDSLSQEIEALEGTSAANPS